MNNTKILVLIILLAIALRAPNINSYFAGDEIDTFGPVKSYLTLGDFRQFNDCNGEPLYNYTHPPLRFVLYSLWGQLFGLSNIVFHILTLIFSLVTILLVFLISRSLFNEKVGLIAAFITAISRYNIYVTEIISTDTIHTSLLITLSVFLFLKYKKDKNKIWLICFYLSIITAFLFKFSAALIIFPLLVYSFIYTRKSFRKDLVLLIFVVIFGLIILYSVSLTFNNNEIFETPLSVSINYSTASQTNINNFISNKIFGVSAVTWQLTPFLGILFLLTIIKIKKTKEFYFVLSWALIPMVVLILFFGGDVQRFVGFATIPIFILVAKYLENINFKSPFLFLGIILTLLISFIIGLNDLAIYHNIWIIAAIYVLSLVFVIPGKVRNHLLLGGVIALGIYLVVGTTFIVTIGSKSVRTLSEEIIERGWPPKEVWTTKDIAYYISPKNETTTNCYLESLDPQFIKRNNIKYIAFYSTVNRKSDINAILPLCKESRELYINGYLTGFLCEIKT